MRSSLADHQGPDAATPAELRKLRLRAWAAGIAVLDLARVTDEALRKAIEDEARRQLLLREAPQRPRETR